MKKIMFNDRFGLTQAVLEGRKTQTRRLIPQSDIQKAVEYQAEYFNGALENIDLMTAIHQLYFVERRLILPYVAGEVVAIAQSYKNCGIYDDKEHMKLSGGWTNKMFAIAELMQHHIKIERIRMERLQDISDEDCLAEGVCFHEDPPSAHYYNPYIPWSLDTRPYKHSIDNEKYFYSARYAYAHLIDKVSGKGTWEKNPFVFVYEFKLID